MNFADDEHAAGKGTLDPIVVRRLAYTDKMRKLVPHCDHATVKYALAVAAKHFGLYSPKTAICDICASMWGGGIDHADAVRGRVETIEEMNARATANSIAHNKGGMSIKSSALLADFHSMGIEGTDRVFVASHCGDSMTAREPLQKMMNRSPAFAVWHTDEELARLVDALSHVVPLRVGRRKANKG